jgi:hypothetical protein
LCLVSSRIIHTTTSLSMILATPHFLSSIIASSIQK